MWLEPISQLLVVLALVSQTGASASPGAAVTTVRQSVFAVPYRIDRSDDPARQPVEVQLHVSTDRGTHWQLYARAMPSQQHFLFRAGGDGEYWFAIRTVDRSGQARPEAIADPGLRVLVDTRPAAAKPAVRREQTTARIPVKTDRNVGPATDAEPKGSVAIAINPAIGKKYVASDGPSITAEPAVGLTPGERPRMVNSRLFELEYDVDSVGPSGIGRVELWGTRDGGKTWRSFTVDSDRRSPLLVSVDEEGIYGFRVAVANGSGMGGKTPMAGDLPDLWIAVDLTKPTARIVSAQQGVDAEAGQLIISWQADDKTLATRPVSLSFRPSRTGPWLSIGQA
jgi:hypothetical protein